MKRGLVALSALLSLLIGAAPATASGAETLSVQEATRRAKPATVLIISEVASEVTLDCGSGRTRVSPPPFRETGTGWLVDAGGFVVTNAHVVQPAHAPPRWLVNQQAQKAVFAACVPEMLAKR